MLFNWHISWILINIGKNIYKIHLEVSVLVLIYTFIVLFFLYSYLFYCCSSTVVSIFNPPHPPAPPIPTSHPWTHPLCLCPCVLYTCSLMDLPLFSRAIPLPAPLCLLSVCFLFQCLWLYFACSFVLLIRFHVGRTKGPETYEKMLSITSHQRDAN